MSLGHQFQQAIAKVITAWFLGKMPEVIQHWPIDWYQHQWMPAGHVICPEAVCSLCLCDASGDKLKTLINTFFVLSFLCKSQETPTWIVFFSHFNWHIKRIAKMTSGHTTQTAKPNRQISKQCEFQFTIYWQENAWLVFLNSAFWLVSMLYVQ